MTRKNAGLLTLSLTSSITFPLAGHHLYSKAQYPHLAANSENIITIKEEVHDAFHAWMGGYDKECTIDDFIKFVAERYPDNDVDLWLCQRKLMLGTPVKMDPEATEATTGV